MSFQTVCEDGLNTEIDIVDTTRLGPEKEGKIRPLRVKLLDEKLKMKVLRNAIQLSRTADDYLQAMFINKNMTRMEMKEDKKLRKQLKNRYKRWTEQNVKIVNTTRQMLNTVPHVNKPEIIPEISNLNDRE